MRFPRRLPVFAVVVSLLAAGLAVIGVQVAAGESSPDCEGPQALRYVAGGDGVPEGKDAEDAATDRYSRQLLQEHLRTQDPDEVWPGPWCEYNTAKEETTSDEYQHEGNPTTP